MSESDGMEDVVRGAMRSALTVAGYAGQQIAQQLTERRRQQEQANEGQARDLQHRYDVERAAARSQVTAVHRDDWWERATPEKAAQMWQTAHGWRGEDRDVDAAARVIEDQVRQRYGVDPAELIARQRAEHAERLRQAAAQRSEYELARDWAREHAPDLYRDHENRMMGSESVEVGRQHREDLVRSWKQRTPYEGAAAVDRASAAAVLAEPLAGPSEKVAGVQQSEILYDSAERREQLATRLRTAGVDAEATEARLVSDLAQGVPTNQAIVRGRKAPKARPSRPNGRQQDRSLSR